MSKENPKPTAHTAEREEKNVKDAYFRGVKDAQAINHEIHERNERLTAENATLREQVAKLRAALESVIGEVLAGDSHHALTEAAVISIDAGRAALAETEGR